MNEEVWFVYLTFACCTNKEMLQCLVMIQDNTVSDSCQKKNILFTISQNAILL